jgi:phosphatidylserine/phosphatidylglycerophosphate/cardiolipin synthase-like enzyme
MLRIGRHAIDPTSLPFLIHRSGANAAHHFADALNAFPLALVNASQIYHWPVEKRERNQAGRPGKLHAKVAIVDDFALVSSANLTDDAFNRNLEVGLLVKNAELLVRAKSYFDSLIATGALKSLDDGSQGRNPS